MENKENNTWEYFGEGEEAEDTLSFCNLTMQEYKDSSVIQSPRDSSAQDFFEFFNDERNPEYFSAPDIIFCGKLVHENEDDQLNEYQKRDYLATVKSHSFRRPSAYDEYPFFNDERDLSTAKNGSISRRTSSSSNSHAHSDSSTYHVQKVNITSLTSMSAKSRRRMFMFGPVKFKPEMELSAIKERQGRRSPKMMFTAPVEDEGKAVVSGGRKTAGRKKSRWNLARSLRGRSHLTAVLAKSFGCIPAASVPQIHEPQLSMEKSIMSQKQFTI